MNPLLFSSFFFTFSQKFKCHRWLLRIVYGENIIFKKTKIIKCKMFICQSSVQRVNYAIFHYITLTILQKEYTVVLEELINIFSRKSCICICSIVACWAGLKGSWRCRRVETDESRPFIYAQVDSQESPASLTWLQVGMLRSYLYLSGQWSFKPVTGKWLDFLM